MRMKRLLAVMAGALCFCSALLFHVQTQAAEQSNGTVTITTTVPETHTATLSITGEGTVTVDGKTYTAQSQELEIPRLEELVWTFTPADGYELDTVLYNGTDVTGKLADQSYKADPVYENGTEVSVTFTKESGKESDTEKGTGNSGQQSGGTSFGKDSPKTGDPSDIYPWMITFFVSLSAVGGIGLISVKKKKSESD